MDTDKLLEVLHLHNYSDFYQLLMNLALVLAGAFVVNLILQHVLKFLSNKLEGRRIPWPGIVTSALSRPLSATVIVYAIYSCLLLLPSDVVGKEGYKAIGVVLEITVALLVGWSLLRVISRAKAFHLNHDRYDNASVLAIARILQVLVVLVVFLNMLDTVGFSLKSLLAVGGVGGIAVGFASKDLLANFFGGLMIYFDRPFSVGDWIRSPDREIEGTVEEIGWRLTIIRTFDKRPLYVPNMVFATISVENPSRMLNRRIYETIGLRYDDAKRMKPIVDDVRAMLCAHPEIDQRQTMIVHFVSFGASSINFFIYTFTKTTEWIKYHGIKEDVMLKIMDIIDQHGAEIAFPTRTLVMAPEPDDGLDRGIPPELAGHEDGARPPSAD